MAVTSGSEEGAKEAGSLEPEVLLLGEGRECLAPRAEVGAQTGGAELRGRGCSEMG